MLKLSLVLSFILVININLFSNEQILYAGYDESIPHHYTGDNGVVIGSDADILREVLEDIGYIVEFIEKPWSRTLVEVEKGRLDIAIGAGFQIKRAEWGYYSIPYKYISHWLYTLPGRHEDIDSIKTFLGKGYKLGVVIGWGYPSEIRRSINDKKYSDQIIKVSTFDQLEPMLEKGRVDGIIAIPESVDSQIYPRAKYREELHFIFSKVSVEPDIVANFNNSLYAIIHSGKRDSLLDKYKNQR